MVLKRIGLIVLSIVIFCAIGINVWYISIYLSGQKKVVASTFNVGLQVAKDGSSNYFIDVLYNRNTDNSSRSLLDIKFNYLSDNEGSSLFSQGIQYVDIDTLEFGESKHEMTDKRLVGGSGWFLDYEYNQYASYIPSTISNISFGSFNLPIPKFVDSYEYMSSDNFETSLISSNPLSENTFFRITMGDKNYLLKLKGQNTPQNESTFIKSYTWKDGFLDRTDHKANVYEYYDMNYLLRQIYQGITALPSGTDDVCVFEFGDIFDYYGESDIDGVYNPITNNNEESLLYEFVQSYFSIHVKINDTGVTNSSQSLFNCIEGKSNYNSNYENSNGEYFVSKTVIDLSLSDFDLIEGETNVFSLKLKEDFVNFYIDYKNQIELSIVIDNDYFINKNIHFIGFAGTEISNFEISKCVKTTTIDGQLVEEVIAYE